MPGTSLKRHCLDLGSAQVRQAAAALREPAECVIVVHHRLAIGADLEIALDGIATRHGGGKGSRGVLDHACGGIVQSAVRDRSRGEPVECGHGVPYFRWRMVLSDSRFPFLGIMRRTPRT